MDLKRHRFDLTEAAKLPQFLPKPLADDIRLFRLYQSATQDMKECVAQSELLQRMHPINDFPFLSALHDASIVRYMSLFMKRGERSEVTLDPSIITDQSLRKFHDRVSQYRHNMLAHYGDQEHMQLNFGIQHDDRLFLDIDETDEGVHERLTPLFGRALATPIADLSKLRAIYGIAHDYLDIEKRKLSIRILSGVKIFGYEKLKSEAKIAPKPPFDTLMR